MEDYFLTLNMDIYSYLYPNKQSEVADQLDVIATADDGYEKIS